MKIERTSFGGLEGLLIETDALRMVAVTEIGPRIAWFSKRGGENLLYWDPDGMKRNGWRLYGGHRVWMTRPLGDESEDTYAPDNDPCRATALEDGVDLRAPASGPHSLARGMEIRVLSETSVQVRNYLQNEGSLICSGGCWSPTCVAADKPIEIPLGSADPACTWDIVHIAAPLVFAGNTSVLEDDQVTVRGNTLVLTPRGRVCKRAARAEQGVVRLRCEGYAFEKRVAFNPLARYPLGGCNVAAFIGKDNFMAEMETFGGEQPIAPGQTIENTEVWTIV